MGTPRILFMGTPEFAVPSLEILVKNGYPIAAVVTQPDRPKGRGRADAPSPIKLSAMAHNLPVLQPEKVRDREFIATFRTINPDMVILVAFGQILPKEIIDAPRMGCLNVHPSLLPKFRGAAPINWTIIRGERMTGVTVIRMAEGVDSGDILHQEETPIGPDESFGDLHDRLAPMGAALLLKAVERVTAGTVMYLPQDHTQATYAPRLRKEDGHIDWRMDVNRIINLIRGLSPIPGAYSVLDGKTLKIFTATGEAAPAGETPGKLRPPTERGLPVTAADGYVYLWGVQLENKKRMSIHDFLRGYRIAPETILD